MLEVSWSMVYGVDETRFNSRSHIFTYFRIFELIYTLEVSRHTGS